jgi:hypothetical protein
VWGAHHSEVARRRHAQRAPQQTLCIRLQLIHLCPIADFLVRVPKKQPTAEERGGQKIHGWEDAMSMETLELGYLLVAERPSLFEAARGLAETPQAADGAVRRALRAAWRDRAAIENKDQLVRRLYGRLQTELTPGCGRLMPFA